MMQAPQLHTAASASPPHRPARHHAAFVGTAPSSSCVRDGHHHPNATTTTAAAPSASFMAHLSLGPRPHRRLTRFNNNNSISTNVAASSAYTSSYASSSTLGWGERGDADISYSSSYSSPAASPSLVAATPPHTNISAIQHNMCGTHTGSSAGDATTTEDDDEPHLRHSFNVVRCAERMMMMELHTTTNHHNLAEKELPLMDDVPPLGVSASTWRIPSRMSAASSDPSSSTMDEEASMMVAWRRGSTASHHDDVRIISAASTINSDGGGGGGSRVRELNMRDDHGSQHNRLGEVSTGKMRKAYRFLHLHTDPTHTTTSAATVHDDDDDDDDENDENDGDGWLCFGCDESHELMFPSMPFLAAWLRNYYATQSVGCEAPRVAVPRLHLHRGGEGCPSSSSSGEEPSSCAAHTSTSTCTSHRPLLRLREGSPLSSPLLSYREEQLTSRSVDAQQRPSMCRQHLRQHAMEYDEEIKRSQREREEAEAWLTCTTAMNAMCVMRC